MNPSEAQIANAWQVIARQGFSGISHLQRTFSLGIGPALALLQELQARQIVGPFDKATNRYPVIKPWSPTP